MGTQFVADGGKVPLRDLKDQSGMDRDMIEIGIIGTAKNRPPRLAARILVGHRMFIVILPPEIAGITEEDLAGSLTHTERHGQIAQKLADNKDRYVEMVEDAARTARKKMKSGELAPLGRPLFMINAGTLINGLDDLDEADRLTREGEDDRPGDEDSRALN